MLKGKVCFNDVNRIDLDTAIELVLVPAVLIGCIEHFFSQLTAANFSAATWLRDAVDLSEATCSNRSNRRLKNSQNA